MNRLQARTLVRKIREKRRTVQNKHLQPVVNKVLRQALTSSLSSNKLVVPKTSKIKMEMSSLKEVEKEDSTKLHTEKKLVQKD